MPKLGEIRKGREINRRGPKANFIWAACIGCGKERWVGYTIKDNRLKFLKCLSCGSLDQGIRGKGYRDKDGYKLVRLSRTDPFYSMTVKSSYVLEHRLVVAKSLGRCLTPDEIVHHLNGIKDDNRIENLVLTTRDQHIHLDEPFKRRIAVLEEKVRILEEIVKEHETLLRQLEIDTNAGEEWKQM